MKHVAPLTMSTTYNRVSLEPYFGAKIQTHLENFLEIWILALLSWFEFSRQK